MTGPLRGLSLWVTGSSPAVEAAAAVLAGLGAAPAPAGAAAPLGGAVLRPLNPHLGIRAHAGLPSGTLDLATGRALAAAALAAWLGGQTIDIDALGVALQVHLPSVMAASYGSDWWPVPPEPVLAPGGGWLNAELGAPGDADSFDRLLSVIGPKPNAAAVAAEAQTWRLAVCEYRPGGLAPAPRTGSGQPGPRESTAGTPAPPVEAGIAISAPPGGARVANSPPLSGIRVLDLTSMWAGPLAGWLLGRLGATVVKIEPTCRPDGTRALTGAGIRPGGRPHGRPGEDSALFNALASGKRTLSLDARDEADHRGLISRMCESDVVIDSFSPRVMPQLGLDRSSLGDAGRDVITISMPAFPPGPCRHWVAYGTGVHALSGLGDQGGGHFAAPAVAYPDPLAGLETCVVILAAMAGRRLGWKPAHLEVPLATTLKPLLSLDRSAVPMLPADPGIGRTLFREAIYRGSVQAVTDGGGRHLYPAGPFAFGGRMLPLTGAPSWPGAQDPAASVS